MYIDCVEYAVPLKKVSNECLKRQTNWEPSEIEAKIGIRNRYHSDRETSLSLAIDAVNKLQKKDKLDEVNYIIFVTQTPDKQLLSHSAIIQTTFFNKNLEIGCIDLNIGCSGFTYGLEVAYGLMKGLNLDKVLLICSDTYSKIINKNDTSVNTLFGDAASATILTKNKGNFEYLSGFRGTDGSGASNLIVPNSYMTAEHNYNGNINTQYPNNLYMNGGKIFLFTKKRVVQEILKNVDCVDEVDFFVFHQANKLVLNTLQKELHISEDKLIHDYSEYGNTVSSSIPIAISNNIKVLKKSDLILLCGFGVGLSWSGCLIRSVK